MADPLLEEAKKYLQCKDPLEMSNVPARYVAQFQEQRKKQQAASLVSSFARSDSLSISKDRHGQFKMPDTVLENVLVLLAGSLEPGGIRGVEMVTRDIASAARVSWDFYQAAKAGFTALAEAVQIRLQQRLHGHPLPAMAAACFCTTQQKERYALACALSRGRGPLPYPAHVTTAAAAAAAGPTSADDRPPAAAAVAAAVAAATAEQAPAATAPGRGQSTGSSSNSCYSWQDWDIMLSNPVSLTKAELLAACQQLGLSRSQSAAKTKAQLVVWLLAAFSLQAPVPAAAAAAAPSDMAARYDDRIWLVQVLWARALERCSPIIAWDGLDCCKALRRRVQALAALGFKPAMLTLHHLAADNSRSCLALARAELAAAGIHDMAALQATQKQQQAAARAAAAAATSARRQEEQQRRAAAAAAQRAKGQFRLDALKFSLVVTYLLIMP